MALIASVHAGSADSGFTVQVGPINCAGATSLAVLIVAQNGVTFGTLSDGVNTYTQDVQNGAAGARAVLNICGSPDVSNPLTITYTCNGGVADYPSLYLQAHSGASSHWDDDSNLSFAATSLAANNPVTPVSGGVVLAGLGYNQAFDTLSIDSGFTITSQLSLVGGQYYGGGFAYYYAPSTSNVNPTWSWTNTADVGVVLESLRVPTSFDPTGFTSGMTQTTPFGRRAPKGVSYLAPRLSLTEIRRYTRRAA